jgi:simple sugar transport system ATP-binding protein
VAGRRVLDGVDFDVAPGEVHALLGENGAGKTTLMNVLVGLVRPDAGRLELGGHAVDRAGWGPAAALRAGVRMVHQRSALVPAMTVPENLAFGDARGGPLFRPRRARAAAAALARRFDLEVPLDRPVDELSPGQRQRAEILRALDRGASVLILDEPTAVLTPSEADRLFASLRALRDAGRAVVFISHKLAEVEEIADRVSVLRRGRLVVSRAARGASAAELGRLMLGEDLAPIDAPRRRAPGEARPLLEIRGLSAPGLDEAGRLRGIALAVREGEILGVVGIDGNGQRELEEVLAGVRRPSAGEVRVRGGRVAPDPRALRRAGVAHLSGDRESAGLVPGMSLAENFALSGSYDDRRFFRRGRFDRRAARRAVAEAARRFSIVPADPDLDCAALSGGNAQKLAVARELDGAPSVLVAANPTRGLDVGSARFVHERLLERAAAGAAVLLVSSDLDEALAIADRLVALVRGSVIEVPAGSDRSAIGAILLGSPSA